MNTPKRHEETLFEAALQLGTPAERVEYLRKACPDDEALRQRVEALLQAHEGDSSFLANPADPMLAKAVLVKTALLPPTEGVGDRIGRYKLLQQIGEGGCGVVYMAEQEEPVRRRVALKVIKLGMDTKQVIARFEAERQALAMMEHPNIAKVFDAGTTEKGRPFFVMELVRGIKITDYCDQNSLPTSDRLKLFAQVCNAVQHAHQKGIIHRDLKPSNVMVTLHDGVPVPKVIDFGIAKATTDQRLTDKTLFTAFEQFIGTPAYMSPEQAEMSGLEVDVRSDVYSLGVLLYELLTGETPFDPRQLLKAGFDEMRRIIREKEPARPSTRLSTMLEGELTAAAKCRRTEAPNLVHLMRGDLDWIVMKCLEKDRARRYDAANSLAADIQRHLDQQPVAARPPSELYRLQKLIHRNRTALTVGGVTVLAVATALFIGMQIPRLSPGKNAKPTLATDSTSTNASAHAVASTSPPVAATDMSSPEALPLIPVSGVVLAEDTGKPLSNALVRIAAPSVEMRQVRTGAHEFYEERTDAGGRFKIAVPAKNTISLDVFAPGYESVGGTYMSGSRFKLENLPFATNTNQNYTIKLKPSLYVAGVVVDEAGRPFSGAAVEATFRYKKGYGYVAFTESDEKGHFEIFDFDLKPWEVGQGQLTFENSSMLISRVEDVYALSEADRKNLRVIMHRGHDIKGVLTSNGGKPVAGTMVDAIPSDFKAQHKEARTDADGRFLIRGLPDGEIKVITHSLALEQKAQTKVVLSGKGAEVNIRLQPVILKDSPPPAVLFGMKLTDITSELQSAYDLGEAKGVLILDPGPNHGRLGIGRLEEGYYFWVVGDKNISSLRQMVTEMLRIQEIEPPGKSYEGYRGSVRIVYSSKHWSNTQFLHFTDDDVAELKRLEASLAQKRNGN